MIICPEFKDLIKEKVDKLNYYTKLYDEGRPEISDKEWDKLYFELVYLETSTGIYLPESPTQRVNYEVKNELQKVTHNHSMLSLNKTKDISEVEAFIGNKEYIVMAKMDGLTCSLYYQKGRLVRAETRGNGIIGEDVTHNALVIPSIPQKISYQEDLIIDGEIICTYKDFEDFSDEYKNPRNFASGSIRLLDANECAKRKLTFVAWDAVEGLDYEYLHTKLHKLDKLGFITVPFHVKSNIPNDNINQPNVTTMIDWIRTESPIFPIDGAVIKYNKVEEYYAAGRTDHHFKGGLAYKFYDEEYTSKLIGIEWSMGRTGQICPIALFEKLNIDGTEVSRASLSNISIMKQTLGEHPFVGQEIIVTKRNQIIPKVERAKGEDGNWI